MLKMTLSGGGDTINLNSQAETGWGWQVHAGVVGLGLPPFAGQWMEGAGDGSTFRGGRTLSRDIDLPLSSLGRNRDELKALTSQMSLMLSGECKLIFHDEGDDWYVMVRRVGGGNWVMGQDTTGERDNEFVLTVRSGDPYWTAMKAKQSVVASSASPQGLLTGSLATFTLAPSQAIGTILLDNSQADAPSLPSWIVEGPGDTFRAVSPSGEVLQWNGTLLAGDKVVLDSRFGRIYNLDTGANLYSQAASAPRFWAIPPGSQRVTASLNNPGPGTKITCTWRPRKWAVV